MIDEARTLLSSIQDTIVNLDSMLAEKNDMIDLLSHDLRSPVNRILGLSNLIKIDDDTKKEIYADYITEECNSLLSVLENILMMLKEDSRPFTMTHVNLKDLIDETVRFFDFALNEKRLKVQVSIDKSIFISVQKELFVQAVRNIMGNAIKFSSDGKNILLSAKQENDRVSLSIKDEGLGFMQSEIERLFDRFTSTGKKGTHGEASIGLGLYLSKKMIEKHDGKLVAASEGINKGATFTIILPSLVIKKPGAKSISKPADTNAAEIPSYAKKPASRFISSQII
jgi:signal transduction histidine kinase